MAEAKNKISGRKIIDVAHPDASAPSETSKPVIVTNRAVLQDPMVVTDSSADTQTATTAPPLPAKSSTQVKLRPISPPAETTLPEPKPTTEDVPAETADQPATAPPLKKDAETPAQPNDTLADTNFKPADKPATPNEPSLGDEGETSAKPGTKQPTIDLEAEAAAETEKDAKLQKIVDSKQYFLPINSVEKRRTKRVIIIGVLLSLVLAVAWADVALDASLIHIPGVKPVTHFFSN